MVAFQKHFCSTVLSIFHKILLKWNALSAHISYFHLKHCNDIFTSVALLPDAPWQWREISVLSAAMMSRFCSGTAGTWGDLLDAAMLAEEYGGWSGIQPIRAFFWQLACTTISKSSTVSQRLVRTMMLILHSLIWFNESSFLYVYASMPKKGLHFGLLHLCQKMWVIDNKVPAHERKIFYVFISFICPWLLLSSREPWEHVSHCSLIWPP